MSEIVGFDLGGSKLLMYSNYNGVIKEESKPTGADYTHEQFRNDCQSFIDSLSFKPKSVGVAIPGLVTDGKHVVMSGVIPGLAGFEADTLLNDKQTPVYFINDIKAATFYESTKCPEKSTVLVVIIGTGMASGVIQNGVMLNGSAGFAGEIGFMPIQTETGIEHLQYLCGGAKILSEAKVDGDTFHKLLQNKDENAVSILNKAASYFGLGLTTLLNLYNPNYVILGGSTVTYPGYLDKAFEVAKKYTLKPCYENVKFSSPEDNKHEVVFGAIEFAKIHLN